MLAHSWVAMLATASRLRIKCVRPVQTSMHLQLLLRINKRPKGMHTRLSLRLRCALIVGLCANSAALTMAVIKSTILYTQPPCFRFRPQLWRKLLLVTYERIFSLGWYGMRRKREWPVGLKHVPMNMADFITIHGAISNFSETVI